MSIVEDAGMVISISKKVGTPRLHFIKVLFQSLHYIFIEDFNVFISIWSTVLIVESYGMAQQTYNCLEVDTGLS